MAVIAVTGGLVWAKAAREARARTLQEMEAAIRMVSPLENDFWRILRRAGQLPQRKCIGSGGGLR
jgi:hypothetical protein